MSSEYIGNMTASCLFNIIFITADLHVASHERYACWHGHTADK
jgi:hypothetical protein